MKHPLLTLLLCLLCTAAYGQTTTFEVTESVYFASASDKLDRKASQQIDAFTANLASYADFSIRLEAFTDEQGKVEYNDKLAEQRAASVRSFLEETGLTATGWEVSTFGEQRAKTNTTDDVERRTDRRVDLVATVTGWTDANAALAAARQPMLQRMTIDPTKQQVIQGKKGGRFFLQANSLVDADGNPVDGPVTVELIEAYDLSDMLLAGLTTTSGNKTLETGGMFSLTGMDAEGNPLKLADGAKVASSIPTYDFNEEMRLFAGREHDETGAPGDWEQAPGRVFAKSSDLLPTNGPTFKQLRWETNDALEYAAWKKNNPKPELKTRKVPSLRPNPIAPDTATIVWQPKGFDKVLASRAKRGEMTRKKVDKAKALYVHQKGVQARRIKMREENTAFNLKAKELYPVETEAWEAAFEAVKDRVREKNRMTNEALKAEYKRKKDAWAQKRGSDLEEALASGEYSGNSAQLSRYFFAVGELGWTNCDIFYAEEDPVAVLATAEGSDRKTTVVLVPAGRRAVLPYSPVKDGSWKCSGIPREMGYQVMAYHIRKGQLLFAHQRVTAAGDTPEELMFNPIAVTDLKNILANVLEAK